MTYINAQSGVDEHPRHSRAGARREYYAYFAVIFLATLPLACITWTLHALRARRVPQFGPVRRAWIQAGIITPMIFSA